MKKTHQGVVWEISEQPARFALAFFVMFSATFLFLAAMDALPEPAKKAPAGDSVPVPNTPTTPAKIATPAATPARTTSPSAPTRVVATSIGLDATISNPTSTNIDVLDHALLTGAVRYPTSAMLGVEGTVLLFAHSSYLPVVHNQAYKTFDGIQDLKPGEILSVFAGTKEYRYSVTGVRVADANEDVIELPSTGQHLTLVTCNSFAAKSNRFVVTADLVAQ